MWKWRCCSTPTICLFWILIAGQLHRTSLATSGFTTENSNQVVNSMGWKKFSVVVPYESALTPLLPPGTRDVPQLSFLTSSGVLLSLKLDQQIGQYHQRCILPPPRLNSNLPADEKDYYNWDCQWVFQLDLRGSRPGTITLQGPWAQLFRPVATTDNLFPRDGMAPPDKQYITITGGTGCFRAVVGVAKIQVQDPLSELPLFRYTFYIKIQD